MSKAKAKTKREWALGDPVVIDGKRWLIGNIRGRDVELQASDPGAARDQWWNTTLDRLPARSSS